MSDRLAPLTDDCFDVLVVGGGIHGATLAWESARRGLKTALIEKGDFGGATSANSLKIIHGGLRYLQSMDFPRMRESILSRRRCMALAPNLVRPARFMVPTFTTGLQSRSTMTAAFFINDLVSMDRNRGLPPTHHIPRGSVLSLDQAKAILGAGVPDQVTGAAVWHDGFVENSERLVYAFARTAESEGAVVANYVRATGLLEDAGRVTGATVRDEVSGTEGEVHARAVVNAAGPWLNELSPALPGTPPPVWTRGYNIVVRKQLFGEYGVGMEGEAGGYDSASVVAREKRNLFFAPWRDTTMVGTLYKPYPGAPADCQLAPEEIASMLEDVNAMCPAAQLSLDDVCFAHVGILPAPPGSQGMEPDRHTEVLDYGRKGLTDGLYAVRGVKFTTAVEVARRLVPRIASRSGHTLREVNDEPLYGNMATASARRVSAWARAAGVDIPDPTCRHLAAEYGEVTERLLSLAREQPELAQPLGPASPVIGAEVVHAVRHEHAQFLVDVVLRRTVLGTAGFPGRLALERCAQIAAEELDWNAERQANEVKAVVGEYERLGLHHALA